MKHTNPSLPPIPGADWQALGELELSAGSDANAVIGTWLTEILIPLSLQSDFIDRVLKSAQDVAGRCIQAEKMTAFEHIHLLVFAPWNNDAHGKTWGFFRIEKAGTHPANENSCDHSIEFYLYLEG